MVGHSTASKTPVPRYATRDNGLVRIGAGLGCWASDPPIRAVSDPYGSKGHSKRLKSGSSDLPEVEPDRNGENSLG